MMCLSATSSHIFKEHWFLSLENGIYCPVRINNLFFPRSFKLNNSEANLSPKPCPCNMASKFCSFLFCHSKQYAYLSFAQIKKKISTVKNTECSYGQPAENNFLRTWAWSMRLLYMCECVNMRECVCVCIKPVTKMKG